MGIIEVLQCQMYGIAGRMNVRRGGELLEKVDFQILVNCSKLRRIEDLNGMWYNGHLRGIRFGEI